MSMVGCFEFMGKKVEFSETKNKEHWVDGLFVVEVDGKYFCRVYESEGLDFDKNSYNAYNQYGESNHMSHDRGNGIETAIKKLMDFLI